MTPADQRWHDKRRAKRTRRLHDAAVRWLMDRANPEEQGGLGVFADSRFCVDLTKLLLRIDRAARREAVKR